MKAADLQESLYESEFMHTDIVRSSEVKSAFFHVLQDVLDKKPEMTCQELFDLLKEVE